MAPRTRAAARRASTKEIIEISSDSEKDAHAVAPKKSKTTSNRGEQSVAVRPRPQISNSAIPDEEAMDIDQRSLPPSQAPKLQSKTKVAAKKQDKNAHLKGRKRFAADLEDISDEIAEVPIEAHGLQIKVLLAGDEEGSVELKVLREGKCFISLNLFIDDSAFYPREHTFYSFTLDEDLPPHILEVVANVSTWSPKSLVNTVRSILASLSASLSQGKYVPQEDVYEPEAVHHDETESDDQAEYDDFIDLYPHPTRTEARGHQFTLLREHFYQVIGAGYKPGLIRLNEDEIVLSVSSPILSLSIPPQALVAWDRRLLSSYNNLTLLISGINVPYPVISRDGTYSSLNSTPLKFCVGLSPRYKPSRKVVLDTVRDFGVAHIHEETEFHVRSTEDLKDQPTASRVNEDPGRFERFSLSSSLESVLSHFVTVLQLRIEFNIGWAGAEFLHAAAMQRQQKPKYLFSSHERDIIAADREETILNQTYSLPPDPLLNPITNEMNLPLLAYSYLVRRFTLCSRYCLVCHTKIAANFEALKPYVCESKLCTYQYYALNLGPSIEYEIRTNPQVVDLLVSLAYTSAYEHQLSDGLPVGLGLRVPLPKALPSPAQYYRGFFKQGQNAENYQLQITMTPPLENDGLCDFDRLPLPLMRAVIVEMIDSLPSIADMKEHLERKVNGKIRPQLKTIDEKILPAAWSILRWCIASSTAHLEEISDGDELISNIDPQWRQFRFTVGAPDKEARYRASLAEVQKVNHNARTYPALYGFHGSSLRNWHSIIRQGLLVKQAINGRAYGDGVYFAKDGNISIGYSALSGHSHWRNSETCPVACVALAEIVNSPGEFTSSQPYYVVNQVNWILCRYLLVKTSAATPEYPTNIDNDDVARDTLQYVPLDPTQPLTMGQKGIRIPEQSHKLQALLAAQRAAQPEHELFDEDDEWVLNGELMPSQPQPQPQSKSQERNIASHTPQKIADDWQHSEEWCDERTYQLLPPPTDSSPRAAISLQKELRVMLKEQELAEKQKKLGELGWYIPPKLMGDNLFRWMVELHSFDPELPIALDMKQRNVSSLLFEIRFPPTFPIQPPFFRIIKPRFLPFIHGGGGHVTGGGSICMDLLVADGWLPSYNLSAILLQIRLAISNLEPRPARLANNWDTPYSAMEALEGFKRAANAHRWTVPEGLEQLMR